MEQADETNEPEKAQQPEEANEMEETEAEEPVSAVPEVDYSKLPLDHPRVGESEADEMSRLLASVDVNSIRAMFGA